MKIEPNNIYLGDAYELIKLIPDKSIDLIVTDPPYELSNNGYGSTNPDKWYYRPYANEITQDNLKSGIDLSILDEYVRVLKYINIYIWCNKEQIYDYMTYFVKEHRCNFEFIIWAKDNPPPFSNGHYLKDKEYCLYFWESGKVVLKPKYETGKTVYKTSLNVDDKEKYTHPTIKPLNIIEILITNSSNEGDIVLDTFLGSGTTALACKHLNRQYIGFEIDEKYYNIAKDRLQGIDAKGRMNLFDMEVE